MKRKPSAPRTSHRTARADGTDAYNAVRVAVEPNRTAANQIQGLAAFLHCPRTLLREEVMGG